MGSERSRGASESHLLTLAHTLGETRTPGTSWAESGDSRQVYRLADTLKGVADLLRTSEHLNRYVGLSNWQVACRERLMITIHHFQLWLERYGRAWAERDPDAVVQLFSANAVYYEEPFDDPMVGPDAIRRYWTEGAKNGQADVTFGATPISVDQDTGFALWQATFRRVPSGTSVELEGVLSARFDEEMRCTEFREWWHRREE